MAEQGAGVAMAGAATTAAPALPRPPLGAIWNALAAVADPEIPVLSVTELGMVRRVAWESAGADTLVVHLTPTYSACPATDMIRAAIEEQLRGIGVPSVRVDVLLTPAWSTRFMTPAAERKLRAYGIAPPGSAGHARVQRVDASGLAPLRRAATAVPCPRCGSEDTSLIAQFGSTACKAQYRCRECLEPFDFFKPL